MATDTLPAPTVDPYVTWDQAIRDGQITDGPDGLPDRAIVPLVEHLRRHGIVTLQSCAGHPGSDDGCLWLADDPRLAAKIARLIVGRHPFTAVKRTHHPERRWEIGWHPDDADRAMGALSQLSD